MESEWTTRTLGAISEDISYGYTASAQWEEVGPRFLRITDIQGGTVQWNLVPFCFITDSQFEKYQLMPGDIVVARTGNSTGENFLFQGADKPVVFASYLIRFRIASSIADPKYVWYTMRSNQWWAFIRGVRSGSAQAGANAKTLSSFKLNLPSLPEQRAIAHILGTLDDKIELNRRMNETLEAMAQALFKSWFVDFDPVVINALRAGNPIPDKFAKRAAWYGCGMPRLDNALGLPEDILRLFPDRFVDSELGPIPEGWEVKAIGAEFDLKMGQSPPGSTYNEREEGIPFFQGRRDFGFRYPINRVYCTAPKCVANAGDTLVSVRAPVGDINMAYETCCVGRGVAAIRHKSGSRSFTYYAIHAIGEQFKSYESEGTVFGAITKSQFSGLLIVAPNLQIVSIFEELVYPIDERIHSNEIESRTFAALRDMLLPKLISGELRVGDVERILNDAV